MKNHSLKCLFCYFLYGESSLIVFRKFCNFSIKFGCFVNCYLKIKIYVYIYIYILLLLYINLLLFSINLLTDYINLLSKYYNVINLIY